ncbi:protein yippee-like [Tripterygium wilfordii]|uniref:Protein yippee-like n=1 Tax=Tripterygium wilfordii TaxID=458696 RepID=A0A7J7C3J5_TRIWF|nr:protein yippee-like At5g53940 [Tripterygium wilfordii]KAF5728693.1 protein yippee-like [Tripterygium wilfordii]
MGRLFLVEVEGRCYRCRFCDSALAHADDILSRSFTCRKGRAFLFNKVVNVMFGQQEERIMLSGMHTVEDILCCCCGQLLGWKYVAAQDKHQKYKEGKFVLERWRIVEEVPEELNLEVRASSSDAENP